MVLEREQPQLLPQRTEWTWPMHPELAAANVETSQRGVVVDAFLRSKTNRRVFAAHGIRQLSPVASYEGRIIAEEVFGKRRAASRLHDCAAGDLHHASASERRPNGNDRARDGNRRQLK
jgi:hypothetical protein